MLNTTQREICHKSSSDASFTTKHQTACKSVIQAIVGKHNADFKQAIRASTTCSHSKPHFSDRTLSFHLRVCSTQNGLGKSGAAILQWNTQNITNLYLRVSEGMCFFPLRRKRHWEFMMGGENNTSRGSGALSPRGNTGMVLPPFCILVMSCHWFWALLPAAPNVTGPHNKAHLLSHSFSHTSASTHTHTN